MFEKLLALMPYNPGLVHQMSFYSRRMREESSVRRLGVVFLTLAFVVQFIAVLNPPQSTFASGDPTNNILTNGTSSPADAKAKCLANTQDFGGILRHYGISCTAVGQGTETTIHSESSLPYYSVGRHPSSCQDHQVTIDGTNYYWRRFNCIALQNAFAAIHVHASDGTTFYILENCGNLVSIGPPSSQATITGTSSNVPTPTPTPVFTPTPTPTPTPVPVTPPPMCPGSPTIPLGDANCKPCQQSTSSTDVAACLVISKSAVNETVGGDANNTTAHPGDVITYTLKVTNNSTATFSNYQFQDSFNDVMDYATIADLHGGSLDPFNNVSWPNVDIPAGGTVTHQVTVKVKDPIPDTPADPANPGRFDLIMTNTYGNTINIHVPASPTKQVEVAAATLPNTGPGTTLFVAAMVVIVAGYFYGRSSLLARESAMAIKETAA